MELKYNILYSLFAFSGGAAVAVQVGVNTILKQTLAGNAVRAAMISCFFNGVGMIPFGFIKPFPNPNPNKKVKLKWWMLCGGKMSASFIAFSILLSPIIGVALFFLMVVLGQLVCSILLDHFGAIGNKKPINKQIVFGLIIVIVSAFLVQFVNPDGTLRASFVSKPEEVAGSMIAAFFVGLIIPTQAVIHKAMNEYLRQPFRTVIVTAIGSTSLLLIATLIMTPFGYPWVVINDGEPWWCWLGGFLGDIFLVSSVVVPKRIGVAGFFVMLVIGQLFTALILDNFGAFGVQVIPASGPRIIGLILSIIGAMLIRFDLRTICKKSEIPKPAQLPRPEKIEIEELSLDKT